MRHLVQILENILDANELESGMDYNALFAGFLECAKEIKKWVRKMGPMEDFRALGGLIKFIETSCEKTPTPKNYAGIVKDNETYLMINYDDKLPYVQIVQKASNNYVGVLTFSANSLLRYPESFNNRRSNVEVLIKKTPGALAFFKILSRLYDDLKQHDELYN